MGLPITFTCDGCLATLAVPAELAGISGPCPYCGTVIASPCPQPEPLPVAWEKPAAAEPPPAVALPRIAPLAAPVAKSDQGWLQARLTTPPPTQSRGKVRRLHPAWWAAAGITFFIGGVAGLWKLWSPPDSGAEAKKKHPENDFAALPFQNGPPVIAPANERLQPESAPDIPPSSDSKPVTMAPPTAVARKVSTAPGLDQPVATAAVAAVDTPGPDPAGPAEPDTEAARAVRKVVPMGGPLARPGEAIVRFLGAATWQERLKYTLGAAKLRPLMESYYRTAKDGAVIPEEVELLRLEPTEDNPKFHYYSYIVYLPGRSAGIPLAVEDTAEGPRVEWRSFVECKDNLLAAFCKEYAPGPQTFRVLIRRCHYFEKDVPDQGSRQCFEISPPDASGTFYAWASLSGDTYKKHFATGERARWDVTSMMTLTLEWQKAESGVAWVQLRNVVAGSWHPELLPAVASH